jgi:hypothetical protein
MARIAFGTGRLYFKKPDGTEVELDVMGPICVEYEDQLPPPAPIQVSIEVVGTFRCSCMVAYEAAPPPRRRDVEPSCILHNAMPAMPLEERILLFAGAMDPAPKPEQILDLLLSAERPEGWALIQVMITDGRLTFEPNSRTVRPCKPSGDEPASIKAEREV